MKPDPDMPQPSPAPHWIEVAVQTPAHSGVGDFLTYLHPEPLPAGQLVRVPLGRRVVLGVVWRVNPQAPDLEAQALRDIVSVVHGLPPLDAAWRQLMAFAAQYYQRSVGELALGSLPPALRDLSDIQLARRLKKQTHSSAVNLQALAPPLSPQQAAALAQMAQHPERAILLFGSTGSGKTEVYLQAVQRMLEADAQAQALLLVPEINLTPQLEARVCERFGTNAVVSLHSRLTPAQRLKHWLSAHSGQARIVLGTRMAVLASMPHLRLIVVDEEHDASYKQQEGARYSARDLALYRGRQCGAQVVLGSATPSLESWHHSRPLEASDAQSGRYLRLHMPARIGAAALPTVRCIDMRQQARGALLSAPLLQAIEARVQRGEQSMLLLNRRGYAPALFCADCGWKSACPHCSAFRVFHKNDRSLRCHHCGASERVPHACPDCGNADLAPVGRGTEQLEEQLNSLLSQVRRPDGLAVRVARIDADTTRRQGALQAQLAQVHSGEVDVLVGTQMIAKGHDFRRITLVAAINPDQALFSSDFRAPERLFALLMQAAGRAGRDASQGPSEMLVQTFHPTHPMFAALQAHDYPTFAASELSERRASGLPPFVHQALLRADARELAIAQGFLNAARQTLERWLAQDDEGLALLQALSLYPAIPMGLQKVAGIERAQMLIESASRKPLHRALVRMQQVLHTLRIDPAHKGVLRWLIDVDPQAI